MLRWTLLLVSLLAFVGAVKVETPGLLGLCLLIGLASFVVAALIFIAERVGTVQQGQGNREIGMLVTAQQGLRKDHPTLGPPRPGAPPPDITQPAAAPASGTRAAGATAAPYLPGGMPRAEQGVIPRFGPRPSAASSSLPNGARAAPSPMPTTDAAAPAAVATSRHDAKATPATRRPTSSGS